MTDTTSLISIVRFFRPFVSPDVYDFWAQRFGGIESWERTLARVVDRRIEANEVVTFTLQPNRHFKGFRPGQHIPITTEVNGTRITRIFSPSRIPKKSNVFSITVKRVAGGQVSSHMWNKIRVGDVLEIGPAFGDMALRQPPWLLLAGGSGIAAIMSLIRDQTSRPLEGPMHLIYWTKARSEICYYKELCALAEKEPLFQVHFALTRESAVHPNEVEGRPSESLLRQLVSDWHRQSAYACGPYGFIESLRDILASQVTELRTQAFTPPPTPATPDQVTIQMARSGRRLMISPQVPLLEALEAQSWRFAKGCRMGICQECACKKISGTTQNLITGVRDSEPSSSLRLCVTRAETDLVLEL